MNLPSSASMQGKEQPISAGGSAEPMSTFLAPGKMVAPFEFRALTGGELEAMGEMCVGLPRRDSCGETFAGSGFDCTNPEAGTHSAVEVARQEAMQLGEREGRRIAKAELDAELRASMAQERQRLVTTVQEFRGARERYFAEVEQEVVKLALAIAARVLHREAQLDPLLLAGVVRVALEKMADRSGVVLRVAPVESGAWEKLFASSEARERPTIVGDGRLGRGECVLETKMGTVELGVSVQLEEIEKGFFDLLNHRPVE